jgi:hypothetical protein
MAFHVEVRQGFRRASAFNLDAEKLQQTVIVPWRSGGPLELGDREWDPSETTLRILEGPTLSPSDLSFGRGWQSAERSARDVTEAAISGAARQAATVCVLAASPSAERALAESLRRLGVNAVGWAAVRDRIRSAVSDVHEQPLERIELVATFVAVDDSDPDEDWLFEAGLALGALGRRAVIARLGDAPLPSKLADFGALEIDMRKPTSLEALEECLRDAGYPLE